LPHPRRLHARVASEAAVAIVAAETAAAVAVRAGTK
jgi:hypothetical protein